MTKGMDTVARVVVAMETTTTTTTTVMEIMRVTRVVGVVGETETMTTKEETVEARGVGEKVCTFIIISFHLSAVLPFHF